MKLNNYLEAINYQVNSGSKFYWKCFGENAWWLDCEIGGISISAVFDTVTYDIYKLELWDISEYRWINPLYIEAYNREAVIKKIDPKHSIDNKRYKDISLYSLLEKIIYITKGNNYLATKTISVDFEEQELLALMKTAHEMNITFNQFICQALKSVLHEEQRNHIL